jgi:hypothetical protein
MRRRLFTLASVLSLLLCASTVVLWVLHLHEADTYRLDHDDRPTRMRAWFVQFSAGQVTMLYSDLASPSGDPECVSLAGGMFHSWEGEEPPPPLKKGVMGFAWSKNRVYMNPDLTLSETRLSLPDWALILCFALPPAMWTRHEIQRRRRKPLHLCPVCSYNLTANTSGVCPECGTKIA